MKLRLRNTSPPSGFCFKDKGTGFSIHSWSLRDAGSQWYHEQLRRGQNVSIVQCTNEVERFTCEQLMSLHDWQQWVILDDPPPVPVSTTLGIREANISVVIPVYKFTEYLKRCIEAVLPQVNQIIVVSDSEEERPIWDIDPDKKVTIFPHSIHQMGFGWKCNYGAKQATGEYIWFLNDDCYPSPECASKLMSVLTANQKIGVVGHLLRYPDGRIQHGGTQRGHVGFPHLDVGKEEPSIQSPTEMEAVTAASMLVRKEAFNAVGGFDESYFLYLEDSDLCLKMREKGWKVYYTPFAQAIHEEHASSKLRTDLDDIVKESTRIFSEKWKGYFDANPTPPVFDSFESTLRNVTIDVVYVHLVGHQGYEEAARKFVDSVQKFPPGQDVRFVIILNSPSNLDLSPTMREVFSRLGHHIYFKHDNSGWDIGGFQAYSKVSDASFTLFLGGTAYCRRPNWILPMVRAFREYGDNAIYGVCGNLGDPNVNVSPHLRTTGFWCAPSILNRYPHVVRSPSERYPFEHGPNCFTLWAWSQGIHVLAVDADGVYNYPNWNSSQGFHRGNQSALLLGDRLTQPPYYHCA